MNKKKAIALLLSAAMVFTMNAAVFAEGTTSVDEEVGVQYVYKDPGSYESTQSNSAKAATYSSNTKNEEAVKEALKAGVTVKEVPVAVNYTGKKIKSKDIVDNGYTAEEKDIETESTKSYWGLYVSANGYAAPVKAVKITTKGRDVGDTITWKIKSVCNAKYVVSMNAAGDVSTLTKKEAKAGLKELKSALNNIKNIEFSTSVETGYYTHVISSTSANAVKKGGWTTELDKVFAYTDSLDN
nr:hypothetical protein [Lachnospiraceae bacterium]